MRPIRHPLAIALALASAANIAYTTTAVAQDSQRVEEVVVVGVRDTHTVIVDSSWNACRGPARSHRMTSRAWHITNTGRMFRA